MIATISRGRSAGRSILFFIAPPGLAKVRDPEQFRRKLALCCSPSRGSKYSESGTLAFLLVLLELISAERDPAQGPIAAARAGRWRRPFVPRGPTLPKYGRSSSSSGLGTWSRHPALFAPLAEALPQALRPTQGAPVRDRGPITLPMAGAAPVGCRWSMRSSSSC